MVPPWIAGALKFLMMTSNVRSESCLPSPHPPRSAGGEGSSELMLGGSHFAIESERDRKSNIWLSLGSEAGCS